MGPPEEWQASWIGMDENIVKLPKLKPGEPDSSRMENPAVMLRHEFDLPPAFTRARAYICGLGYYELRINGAKVGKNVLDPGFTDYDKRMLFVTHELNEHLKPGRNAVAVLLGGGWYDMPTPDVWDGEKAPWRRSPACSCASKSSSLTALPKPSSAVQTGKSAKLAPLFLTLSEAERPMTLAVNSPAGTPPTLMITLGYQRSPSPPRKVRSAPNFFPLSLWQTPSLPLK